MSAEENTSWFAAAAPQSNVEGHLRSGTQNKAFLLLSPETQRQVIAKVNAMSRSEQEAFFAQLADVRLDQWIALAEGAPAAPMATPQVTSYTVRPGDSLAKIARAHHLELAAVIAANPQIDNPNLIYPDQVIALPQAVA